MKTFCHLTAAFAFLPFILSSARPGLPGYARTGINHQYKKDGKGVLLVYAGTMKGPQLNVDIAIHCEMDPAIGIRYEVVFERGNNPFSHIAIFYKFSKPDHSIEYNFIEHKSYLIKNSGGTDDDPDVEVVGKEMMDKYSCTHLQYHNTDNTEKNDYWMCQNLQGFQAIIKVLNKINSSEGSLMINGTVFRWGGLVKYRGYTEDKQTGTSGVIEVNLVEANAAIDFPASDFDVPSN